MNKKLAIVFLAVVLVGAVAYVYSSMPTPAPLSEFEKTKLAEKIEWSGKGNVMTGKLPIIEIPKKDPVFRVVRVFSSGTTEDEYCMEKNYLAVDFGSSMSIDIGNIIRNRIGRK